MPALSHRRAMPMSRFMPAIVLSVVTLVGPASVVAQSAAPSAVSALDTSKPGLRERFDDAMSAYERNHWERAYGSFVELADLGHAEAARLSLQMWRYGPALYGTRFVATPHQVEQWARLSGCAADSFAQGCAHAMKTR